MDAQEKKEFLTKLAIYGGLFFLVILLWVRFDTEKGTRQIAVTENRFSDEVAAPFHMEYEFDLRSTEPAGAQSEAGTPFTLTMRYGSLSKYSLFTTSIKPGETVHYRVVLGVTREKGRNLCYDFTYWVYDDFHGLIESNFEGTVENGYPFSMEFLVSSDQIQIENVQSQRGGIIIHSMGYFFLLIVGFFLSLFLVPRLEGAVIRVRRLSDGFRKVFILTLGDVGLLAALIAYNVPGVRSLFRSVPGGPEIASFLQRYKLNFLILGLIIVFAVLVLLYRDYVEYAKFKQKKPNLVLGIVKALIQLIIHMVFVGCLIIWIQVAIGIVETLLAILVFCGFSIILAIASASRMSDDEVATAYITFKMLDGIF